MTEVFNNEIQMIDHEISKEFCCDLSQNSISKLLFDRYLSFQKKYRRDNFILWWPRMLKGSKP